MKQGLGTQLRHLIELLDGAVAAFYDEAGIDYRPRYTPVMRALAGGGARTVGDIAALAGITQPAATQTVALMLKDDLVTASPSPNDARQKLVQLSARGRRLLPALQRCWAATNAAADGLDGELPYPLSAVLAEAIAALDKKPFGARIRAEHAALNNDDKEAS
jgi:DNA-binding MarR family transcriptional regulator